MPNYVILAQSRATARALNAWLMLIGNVGLKESDKRWIVWEQLSHTDTASVEAYTTLAELIEEVARGNDANLQINKVIVLVDAVNPVELDAIAEGGSWNHLIAMLILTFPEIRWIFGTFIGQSSIIFNSVAAQHNLSSMLTHPQRDPLLDATGLRDWVRSITNAGLREIDDLQLPIRQKLAAAIDEEKPYAYLHGYTAYRFGCRADLLTTWTLMKARFGKASEVVEHPDSQEESHGYWLLLEDMSLNFPDREKGVSLLRLEERSKQCSKLGTANETSDHRILVTTGQSRPGDTALAENRSYLKAKSNGRGKIVFKPASGIFGFWARVGLFFNRPDSRRKGNAPDFKWPPPPQLESKEATGHSAPGKLMLIAENLIRRAQLLKGDAITVPEAVHGAVLALDALELTGGRTPTTAIDALTSKHSFEVRAECQFSGVEYHIWMEPRLKEIASETTAICRWFHAGQRKSAALNAEMHILGQLVAILRESNQFDEEQVCMKRVRRLHHSLWMRQKPMRRLFWPLLRYLELLLSSFPVFVMALLSWVFVLSLLFWWAGHPNWEYGLSDAVTSFFSVGGPIHPENELTAEITGWRHVAVTSIAILSGFLHLGVFISHLYSITMRR
jgi:hypothetical protein